METITTKRLLDKAVEEYHAVLNEINRPQEDLVMVAACELIKNSARDFLIAFLSENEAVYSDTDDLLTLKARCAEIQKSFNDLNYDSLACLAEEDSMPYTNSLEDVRLMKYVHTLQDTRDMVLKWI